jgi:hypothetical protein
MYVLPDTMFLKTVTNIRRGMFIASCRYNCKNETMWCRQPEFAGRNIPGAFMSRFGRYMLVKCNHQFVRIITPKTAENIMGGR